MIRAAVICLSIGMLNGCAAQTIAVTPEITEAVRAAELFVARHGFTAAGHPADQPVEMVTILDGLYDDEQLLAGRKGSLESRAFGISKLDDEAWYVLFRATEPGIPDTAVAVLVEDGHALQVLHANYHLNRNRDRWQELPPNQSLEPTRNLIR